MLRRSSGSSCADSAVEPTRSMNITVSCRRSAACASGRAVTVGGAIAVAPASANRLEQALAMPQRHTELFEIALGQLPEHLDVYFVVAENGLVAAKPEAAQPITDVHARVSTAPPR